MQTGKFVTTEHKKLNFSQKRLHTLKIDVDHILSNEIVFDFRSAHKSTVQLDEIVFYFKDHKASKSMTADGRDLLVGDWIWCDDGVNDTAGLHTLEANGAIKQTSGFWKILEDGRFQIGRLTANDVHIGQIIDKNMIEIIDPERNPSPRLIRVGRACPGYGNL